MVTFVGEWCASYLCDTCQFGITVLSTVVEISTCSNVPTWGILPTWGTLDLPQASDPTAFFWFQSQNTTSLAPGNFVTGLVRCNALIDLRNASVEGRSMMFDTFTPNNFYVDSQATAPLLHPISTVLWYFLNTLKNNQDRVLQRALAPFTWI